MGLASLGRKCSRHHAGFDGKGLWSGAVCVLLLKEGGGESVESGKRPAEIQRIIVAAEEGDLLNGQRLIL